MEGGEKINKIITKIILYNNHVYCTYHIYELCRAAVWHCYHFGTLIYIHIVCVCVCMCVCEWVLCVCVCVCVCTSDTETVSILRVYMNSLEW